ncbi:MAG TPA: hypothetical protein VE987_07880 [Polyangiaceae bacterium]|nr:hypothetical protein [Polyangiaceae bacterium]
MPLNPSALPLEAAPFEIVRWLCAICDTETDHCPGVTSFAPPVTLATTDGSLELALMDVKPAGSDRAPKPNAARSIPVVMAAP